MHVRYVVLVASVLSALGCGNGPGGVTGDGGGTDAPPANLCGGSVCAVGSRQNSTATCESNVCVYRCVTGYADCDGDVTNGCERATTTGSCACQSPRPIGPLSGSVVQPGRNATSGRNPTIRFKMDMQDAPAAAIQFCANRACTTPLAEVAVTSADAPLELPMAVLMDGMRERPMVFWRTRGLNQNGSPCATEPSRFSELFLLTQTVMPGPGGVWGNTPDLNGDGTADIAIGDALAPRVFLYFLPVTTRDGTTPPGQVLELGSEYSVNNTLVVQSAGDVNGDGIADLAVATKNPSGVTDWPRNAVLIFHGRSEVIDSRHIPTTPATTLTRGEGDRHFGSNVAGLGDVNGDGYGDLGVLRAEALLVYMGSASGLPIRPSLSLEDPAIWGGALASPLATAGDVNGDGYADVIVGSWATTPELGRARVYYGGSNGLSMERSTQFMGVHIRNGSGTPSGGETFGKAVSTAGDRNGDGYIDVVVGQPGTNSGHFFFGSANGIASSRSAVVIGNGRAGTVISVGDWNRDGLGDVISADANREIVNLLAGSRSEPAPDFTTFMGGTSTHVALALSALHDVNADGYTDALITRESPENSRNEVVVLHGGPAGIPRSYADRSAIVVPPPALSPSVRFGRSIAFLAPRLFRSGWF